MTYTITYEWTRRVALSKEQGMQQSAIGLGPYRTERTVEEEFTDFVGAFEVTIDTDALGSKLACAASRSKTGRAILAGGIIKCRQLRQEITGKRQRTNPRPNGFKPLPEAKS